MAIEQQTGDHNLYASAATVYNKTAAADGQWELDIRVGDGAKDLHTNAATLTLVVTVGGATIGGGSASTAKDAAVLRAALRTGPIFVANGQAITATLQSNNSNDTDVDVTVTPRRVLDVDNDGKVAVPDTQKVDVNTFKTQAVTCGAGVTVNPNVGTMQPVNFTGTGASADVKATLDSEEVTPTTASKTGYALSAAERNLGATALLDLASGVETDVTLRQTLQRIAAVLAGKVSGAGSGLETFKGLDGSTTRVQVTTDTDGNRSNVEYT